MSATQYASVLGLGFGDCGKGLFIDALTRRWQAHTIVRFNGGAQAGHNVVTGSTHHTFSQFGAGTLVPGVHTLLLHPMVVHPTALIVEAEVLASKGIDDVLSRLMIDARCRVTTPFHQAAGRIRERLRTAAHGTCGVGVGETVRCDLEQPSLTIRCADLLPQWAKGTLEKLEALRASLLDEFEAAGRSSRDEVVAMEMKALKDETLAERWLRSVLPLARQCLPASLDEIAARLKKPGCVLFEGAQGALLDEWRGFHPHTTWSSISTSSLEEAVVPFDLTLRILHHGVLRTYLTRHGAGPLPTHDEALDLALDEPFNQSAGWQGEFRRGHPDAVLLHYALEGVGRLDGLLITHLDVFEKGVALKWCEGYETASKANVRIDRLPVAAIRDLDHQSQLTRLLDSAKPRYSPEPVFSEREFLLRLQSVTSLPVIGLSRGSTYSHVSF